MSNTETSPQAANFIRNIIQEDLKHHKNNGKVQTRFPPEPNGYLHLGHVKSICLNFGMAEEFSGQCNLRFDDTNPEKENLEYMENIKKDVQWLGFEWQHLRHASDYFPQLLAYAFQLIDQGDAYVDSQNAEQIRENRGTLTEPGKNSPYRGRSPEENRALFEEMIEGKYPDGAHVLRAKIDMASPNINMRDPVIYRIRHAAHFHAGDSWKVYPMYDYTHCLSDMIEGITHSLCTLEFEDHRPLYDWVLDKLNTPCHPQQIEFSRLNLEYTALSKRRLIQLVQEKHVNGWDDPRMPTIAGLRRRGIPAKGLREFCKKIGISKADGTIEMSYFENVIRDTLNQDAARRMVVLNPLKVTITSLSNDFEEHYQLPNHPQNPEMGTREVPFSNTLYIEQEDFSENPPKKWKRLAPGESVRLRGSYVITCEEVIKDDVGNIIELKCRHDPATLGKNPEGYKPNGVIHWVSAKHAEPTEIRQYGLLFTQANPMAAEHFLDTINPESLHILNHAYAEPAVRAEAGTVYQLERQGYYAVDSDTQADKLVLNLTVGLRDSWK
ncbi:glutamine--tRNA ligase/YqeY domain fusion protein [Suttonella ornithocola]|uniref:Glutamine--tRNA ligase n=1 Tax=Suttonella ornithocola TaxID=279832 RepID=A0A380MZW3_9GAMM|nr:glutamine--tRNA ligase/YqeY domain fusion protein [Suttonella ornithocola]SUO97027.1 Glutamine--tRNA ligase [Suttonella ornithocola]